jgi:hypothetical protein
VRLSLASATKGAKAPKRTEHANVPWDRLACPDMPEPNATAALLLAVPFLLGTCHEGSASNTQAVQANMVETQDVRRSVTAGASVADLADFGAVNAADTTVE